MGDHLQFTAEVVGQQRREQIDLITDPGAGRDIIELIVGFELGKDPLLTAPALVEGKRLASAEALIGENDLELVAVRIGDEEVELDRFFIVLFDSGSNKEEPMARLPNLGFPGGLKVGATLPKRPPPATPLNLSRLCGPWLIRQTGVAMENSTFVRGNNSNRCASFLSASYAGLFIEPTATG